MLKTRIKRHILLCSLLALFSHVHAQQLKLGDPTSSTVKAALLELNSTNQGLLLPRVSDTTVAPLSTSPDGMVIYYIPAGSLLLRRNGTWSRLADSTAVSNNQWLLTGNALTDSTTRFIGSTNGYAFNIGTNNISRVTVSSTGNVGIGTTAPTALLDVKTGAANTSGVRLENLTSASSVTAGAGGIGVDASGNVVRTATPPVYYNAAGIVSQPLKIFADSLTATTSASGQLSVNISSAGFTKILSITATVKGGTDASSVSIPVILGYSLTAINFQLVQNNSTVVLLLNTSVQGLTASASVSRTIFVNVVGY
ncbi:hypothetical protein ACDQ55_06645 [Chitinophaga sp. 30R24]|uniref:hypothetical protein n=1 Tax=Chitinophaga sp. 30R24 TaxID=3248838 RepID=UPI003B90C8A4